MFKNITQASDLTDASWEIIIMLAVAFLLGYLFHWAVFCRDNHISSDSMIPDDLKKIEGIGPKIEKLLNDASIYTFKGLSKSSLTTLKQILQDAGPRFKMHIPQTWIEQANIAAKGDWDTLRKYQELLSGGKKKGKK